MIINTDEWLTAAEAEQSYNLFSGCIRQDIRRNKFDPADIVKLGHTWLVKISALDRYKKESE